MEGDGMVAIVQGLKDCGLAVTVVNKQQFANSLRSSSPNAGSSSPRAIDTADRMPVNNTASQITDGHYTSTYQVAHCNARPTSPRDYVTEFPPQRLDRCPNQGNFKIGTGEYSMPLETSRARNLSLNEPSSLLGYSWLNDIAPGRLSPTRHYDIPSGVAEFQPGRQSRNSRISPSGRECPIDHLSPSGRLSPSPGRQSSLGWSSPPIAGPADSDKFANSLRRYPLASPERNASSELVQKLLNYTQNKHLSKMSMQRTRSPHESPTIDVTPINIQTYTRSKSEPTKVPGPGVTNKIQSKNYQKRNKADKLSVTRLTSPWSVLLPCRSISPKRSNSPTRSTSPERSTSPKRTNSPERSTSPKRSTSPNRVNSPESNSPRGSITPYKFRNSAAYDYLETGRMRKTEVRYLDDVRKCIRDTLKQIYDDTTPAICPNVDHRYSRHRKLFHGENDKGSGTEAEHIKKTERGQGTEQQPQCLGFFPCNDPVPQSSWHVPANRYCKKKRWPCICTYTSKDPEEVKLGTKIAEETFNWAKDLPVYADEAREDKVKREEMVMDLVNNLKRMIGDPDFENNSRNLIAECIEQLPIWYPGGKQDQKTFQNQITDELVNRLSNVVDKMPGVVSKWLKGLEFTIKIDKGEVVNNIVKRLKPLADQPEDMKTELKNMLQDLPILNKTKIIENISGKLVDDLTSVAADVFLEKEIKKELDNTSELSNGENNTKDSKKLAKKIRQTLNRELADSNYQEVVREVVDDWVEDITSSEKKLCTRTKANLADRLVTKLKSQEKFQPKRRDRSLSNQEDYVDFTWNWLTNNDVIPEENRKKYEDPVKILAKKLQELQSSGAGDDKTEGEIMNFLDYCTEEGKTIVNKHKLAKKFVTDLKKTNERLSLLRQYEDRTTEWLMKVVDIPKQHIEKYKSQVKNFVKNLQNLQSKGAGEDKIAEEIVNLLDYFTEKGETVINKDKLAKKLINDLTNTDKKPNLLKLYEDRTSEWLTEVVDIPEENLEKYKGPVKDFAKKLQILQSRGAGGDEITDEIMNFLDYFTEEGETIVNKDKLAKKLVKDLKKTNEKPSLLEQYEDRTSEWLTEVVDIPEENIEKYKGPVKDFAKKLQKLQSRGAGGDEITDEIMNFLDYFTEEGETIVNKDKLAKKLVKDLKKTNEKPSLLEQYEDRTSEWLTEVVDIPEEHIEKYKGPVKDLAKKLQKLLSIEAGDDEIAKEIHKFCNYLINEGETVVNKDNLVKNLMKDILCLGEQNRDITKSKKIKSEGDYKFSNKKKQGVKSSGTSDDETTREKFPSKRFKDKKTADRKPGLKEHENRDRELLKEKVHTAKVINKRSKRDSLDKKMQGSSITSDDETTDGESMANKTAKNLSNDPKTDRKPNLGKHHENELTSNILSAPRKQSILKEISGLIEDLTSNISKSKQSELKNDIANILTQKFNILPDKNNKVRQDIKNILKKGTNLSDRDASKTASAIINKVKCMPKTSKDQNQYFKIGNIHDIMKEFDIHPNLESDLIKTLTGFFTDLEAGTVSTEKTKHDLNQILQEAGLSATDANDMAEMLLINKNLTLKTQDSVVLTKRRSSNSGPKELTPMQRENFVEIAEKEIADFVNELKKDGIDDSPEVKKTIKEKLSKLAEILGEIISDPTVKDKKKAAHGHILDFFNDLPLKTKTSMAESTKLLTDRILNIGFQTSTPKNEGFLPNKDVKSRVTTSQMSSHIDETCQSTSIPVQDSNEFIKENLKGGIQDWLKSLPLYQRKNSKDKRDLENMIPRLVSVIMSVIEKAPTAVQADKLFIEEIVKQLKKSPLDAELKCDETFLKNTAEALLENLNELQLFQDISDRQETLTDPLQAILDDWMGTLAIKRLNSFEAMEFEKLKEDFASKLEKLRKKDPNHDEKIKNFIHRNLFNFPIEESTKENQKLMHDKVENLFRNLLIVPIKESEYKSKVIKKAADILFDAIEDWCEKLPFKSTSSQAKQELAKKEIACKLINKIGELNMNPEVFNDEFLYSQMFEDELDNLLADMFSSDDMKYLPTLKKNFLEKVKKAREKTLEEIAGQSYKHELRDTISKNVPFQTLSAEERAAFEAVQDIIVDAFINLHYVGDNEEQKQKYKSNIKKELSKFCDDYLQNHKNVPLDTAKLNENLYQALKAVPISKDDTLIPEVELAKVKEEVNKWLKELPLRIAGDEKLKVDKLAAVLAKKIRNLEKQNELEHNTDFDDILTKAILQWMDKLPKHLDENIKNTYANKLVDNLGKTREIRRVSVDMRRSIDAKFLDETLNKSVSCKERCKLPCSIEPYSILSIEDTQHLEQIRARAKSTQQNATGSQTATPPCKKLIQEAGSPAEELVPRLIVKEYYWDTASGQYVESHSPCSREYPPLSPIYSPRSPNSSPCSPISSPRYPVSSRFSPISTPCSMSSPIYSPTPGSCVMPHRLYSPPSSNARLGSPKHTALSQQTLEADPCRSENRPASYQHQATGYEQGPSAPSADLSQRSPSRRLPDDHEPCSPCPFDMTQTSPETPPASYHRAEISSGYLHCRGHCAKTMLGADDKRPCRQIRGHRNCSRQKLEDCVRAQPFGNRTQPEGFSCHRNLRERNEEMRRCSKCCGIHCPFPSYMYFK